jgi:hypothetical protein
MDWDTDGNERVCVYVIGDCDESAGGYIAHAASGHLAFYPFTGGEFADIATGIAAEIREHTESTIAATITGRGAASTVPDNKGAVDAEITIGGEYLCDVTLLPSQNGELVTWGSLYNWCTNAEAGEQYADAIVDAVRHATA